jgi:hypothetical protein
MPNGHYVELRLSTIDMEAADVQGHPMYERIREIDAIEKKRSLTDDEIEERKKLSDQSKNLYDQAWRMILIKNK